MADPIVDAEGRNGGEQSSYNGLKIAHVTTLHSFPDPRIYLKECVSLAEVGFQVEAHGCTSTEANRFEFGEVLIRSLGPLKRSAWARGERQVRVACRLLKDPPDLVHFHDPELLPLMLVLRFLLGGSTTFVFDVHENYFRTLQRHGWWALLVFRLLFRMAEKTMGIVLAEDSYLSFCRENHAVVHNYPVFEKTPQDEAKERAPRLVYLGWISKARGGLTMVEAFARADLGPEWELVLIGGCNEAGLLKEIASRGADYGCADRIHSKGYLPLPEARNLLRDSRIALCLLHPDPNYTASLPSKVFEYLEAGVPTVLSDFPFYRRTFGGIPGVTFANPLNLDEVVATIEGVVRKGTFALEEARQAKEVIQSRFNWDTEARVLVEKYRALLGDCDDG